MKKRKLDRKARRDRLNKLRRPAQDKGQKAETT